jgi:hypothetical protein
MNRIIDTNVPIIANGDRSKQASLECRETCIRLLRELIEDGRYKLVIDLQWIVLKEYSKHLHSDQSGLGNQFLRWVLTNRATDKCVLVKITEIDIGGRQSFTEFPNDNDHLKAFDPADRKWIAAALAYKTEFDSTPPISQAADMKWKQFENALFTYGITIDFICDSTRSER